MLKPKKCLTTGKRIYPSEPKAREHLKKIRRHVNKGDTYPTRCYFCSFCQSYHLTSQEQKEEKIELINKQNFQNLIGKQQDNGI